MKNSIFAVVGALLTILFLSGCMPKFNNCSVFKDNAQILQKYKGKVEVSVDEFGAKNPNLASSSCRISEQRVRTQNGESFAKYIENALIDELKTAGIYNENADIKISGYLKSIFSSSMIGDSYWDIVLNVSSSNGKSFEVRTKRSYPSSFVGVIACNKVASQLSPTVAKLVYDIITNEKFDSLLEK